MDDRDELVLATRQPPAEARLYAPSWVDQLTDRVDRLPLPSWVFYLILWLLLFMVVTLVAWSSGSYPAGVFLPLHLVLTGTIPYSLALIHTLDQTAKTSLTKFRPALDVTDREFTELEFRLTTLPRVPTIVASLIAVGLVALILRFAPGDWWDPASSPVTGYSAGGNILVTLAMWWMVGAFAYHTLHQLRLVSHIYARYTRINLFRLTPLYAFSSLSARTTVGLLIPLYAWIVVLPNSFNRVGHVSVAIAASALALLIFIWPLVGIHRLLADEKERLLAAGSQRMEAAVADLHERMDGRQLEGMDDLVKGMEGLEMEQKAISRISTWPWAAEPRGLIAALLFPLIVWFGQWILQRALGG
ncbi:MAG: hypothetical protein U0452_08745 [Anaerolineae bacterium]